MANQWTPDSYGYHPAFRPSSAPAPTGAISLAGIKIPTTRNAPSGTYGNVPEAEAAQVANVLANPKIVGKTPTKDQGVTHSWIQRLFDTTDTADNPVETVWDGMLKGLTWTYDRIAQVESYGLSVLPAGVPTYTWEQAGKISPGQTAIGNIIYNYNALSQNANQFNILDETQRKATFEESLAGKLASGGVDLGLMLFADPFMLGGKAAKMTRIKYLDKGYTKPEELAQLGDDLTKSLSAFEQGADIHGLHPVAQGVIWATAKGPDGSPMRSAQEIMSHLVFKQADNPGAVADVLLMASTPEEGALAVRYMLGDLTTVDRLKQMRLDIVDEIQTKHRELLEATLTFRPQSQSKMLAMYQNRLDQAAAEYQRVHTAYNADAKAAGGMQSVLLQPELDAAFARMDQAAENFMLVKNFKLPDPAAITSADKLAAEQARDTARDALKQAMQHDRWFQKALGDEQANVPALYGALRGKAHGFSADTQWGRWAEGSRQQRATAAFREKATKRAGAPLTIGGWQKDVFGTPGYSRLMNLWRWAGDELPSGRIGLLGRAADGSAKELAAVLNDVSIYSGEGKTITRMVQRVKRDASGAAVKDAAGKTVRETVPETFTIGGVGRKEEILRQFINASGDSAMDVVARKRVIDNLEGAIMNDLALWHNLDPSDIEKVTAKAQMRRDSLIEFVKSRGYWIDENGHINRSPFLDSHLENASYLLNFHSVERQIEHHLSTGGLRMRRTAVGYASDRLIDLYDMFNEVWRPATLLRLGYTQRNVTEGLIRATAFAFAADPRGISRPLIDAMRGVKVGAGNIKLEKKAEAAAFKIAHGGTSKRYDKWIKAQIAASDNEMSRLSESINTFTVARDEAIASKDTAAQYIAEQQLKYVSDMMDAAKNSRSIIDDPDNALALYRQQGKSKMRLYSGDFEGNDALNPFMLRQAFNDRSGVAEVMWGNMSSAGNRRLEAMLSADGISHVFLKKLQNEFVNVKPTQGDEYFDGVARVLMQYKNSKVGTKIINGENPERIAIWMRENPEGRQLAEFLGAAKPRNEKEFTVISMTDADSYISEITRRFMEIAPAQELRDMMKSVDHIDGKMVKRYLEGRNDLVPVVGNHALEVGTNGAMDVFRSLSHIMFNYLGTLPEDALVRGPFYGRRFNEILQDLTETAVAQKGVKQLTVGDLNRIKARAHASALSETKQTLYTIERRTNLGQLGEYIFPFISASQNSVTAFGRLIWQDPRIGVAMVKMWQAPEKSGWADEQGNIMLPIPHALIPDGVEQALGIDNMMGMKINKNGLNVIYQLNGTYPVPSPGPLVVVPASEIMKHGWFGQSIDAPGMLKAALGEQTANQLWDGWKQYLFGDQKGVSSTTLSADLMLPPWVQKAMQMMQGELNSSTYAYQYSLQLRTEHAKYIAGYRDTPPTAEEIRKRTNGLYALRILGNLTAFTPPQYVSKLQPLIDAVQMNKQINGLDANRVTSEQFGEYLMMLGDFDVSKNPTGATASTVAYANSRKYSTLIERIAPEMQDDLSPLGIILNNNLNEDTSSYYDPNVRTWQYTENIPGLAQKYREMQSPQESLVDSQRSAGWVAFSKGMDVIDAIRQQRGLKSIRSAADLTQAKKNLIARLANDPQFAGWYDDYQTFGSARVQNTVKVLTAALNDPKFVADNANNSTWQAARIYLTARDQVVQGRITSDQWDQIRGMLVDASTTWATLANRYLSNDDDPAAMGVSFGTMGVSNG